MRVPSPWAQGRCGSRSSASALPRRPVPELPEGVGHAPCVSSLAAIRASDKRGRMMDSGPWRRAAEGERESVMLSGEGRSEEPVATQGGGGTPHCPAQEGLPSRLWGASGAMATHSRSSEAAGTSSGPLPAARADGKGGGGDLAHCSDSDPEAQEPGRARQGLPGRPLPLPSCWVQPNRGLRAVGVQSPPGPPSSWAGTTASTREGA